jgi:hypothetical protein
MYIVYVRIGNIDLVLNTWLDYLLAFREAESLNKRDYKGYYYVVYREKFNGKNNDF